MLPFRIVILLIAMSTFMKAQDFRTLSGIVRDSASGEALISATVAIYTNPTDAKPIRGAITNKFGFFSIPKLPLRNYTLTVRSIGYKTLLHAVSSSDLENNKQLSLALMQQDLKASDVVVEADRNQASGTQTISTVSITSDFIRKMPALLGETDIFRVLQMLPGVKSPSELSSGLYVRGGSPDQNLVLLDNVVVYNPSHLGGFLSTFNNDAVRDVRLIKGGFPAEYGGRLSSVIDITMKDGTKEKVTGQGGLSVIAARMTLEGPINEDITFMVSARRMYLDLLLGLALSSEDKKNTPDYYFYDFNAKVNYKISDKDRIYASGFFGRDVIGAPPSANNNNSNSDEALDFGINWGNSTAGAKWVHIFSPELFGNCTMIYTTYNFGSEFRQTNYNDIGAITNSQFTSTSQIRDIGLKADVQYFPDELHTVKAGIEATQHRFVTSVGDEFNNQFGGFLTRENTINALDAALYLQDEWRVTDKLSTNLGGRLYYFQNGNYLRLEPRAQVAFQMNDDIKFTSAFSVANQFLHLITRNDINLPTDLWFPSTKTILPSTSIQGMVGFETTFGEKKDYLFTAEAYYKDMRNLLEYKDTASFSFGTPVETQFVSGRGEAYGLELFLNKRVGDFTGWLGYTLSLTKRYFDELDNGHPFYARYDSRHDLSATFTYDLSETIELGAAWIFQTGFAYTMPIGTYNLDPSSNNNWNRANRLYSDRNAYRLPSYHRLDVNLGWKTHVFGLKSTVSLSIYNLYNRKNPFAQYVENDFDENTGEVTPVLKQLTLFPLLPILSWSFTF